MNPSTDFAGRVPGFEFLQTLMKNAGSAFPGMGQWVTPTLDPAEIDKRIQELRTVQFWLEQNARLLATTIQALEVQRMTLSTLQSMNLPLVDVRDALMIKTPPAASSSAPGAAPEPVPPAAEPAAPAPASDAGPAAAGALPAVDPMQWWGALTKQFGEIAAGAVGNSAAGATPATAAMKTTAPAERASGRAPARKSSPKPKPKPKPGPGRSGGSSI